MDTTHTAIILNWCDGTAACECPDCDPGLLVTVEWSGTEGPESWSVFEDGLIVSSHASERAAYRAAAQLRVSL